MPNGLRGGLVRRLADGLSDGQLLQRYLARRDGSAFAALVERHGPMVLGVCRRVLGRGPDAEDAFQSTFLVLVRRAASVVPRDQVGRWLYGVACRTALQARAATSRRRALERRLSADRHPAPPLGAEASADWRPLIDEELSRLPERYRSAIRVCDLEGRSRKEAARLLGWPEGTLSGRLARARRLLARRLARRGVTLAAVLAAELGREAAAVPPGLLASVVRIAAAPGGTVPPPVAALTEGVVQAMRMPKVKIAAAVLMVVGVCVLGAGLGPRLAPANEAPAAEERRAADERSAIFGDWRDDAGNRWVITADEISVSVLGSENVFSYRLDPTQRPAVIDVSPKPATGAPPAPGIYRFEGSDLVLCLALGAWKNRRPTEFTTTYRSQCVRLHSLAPAPPATRDDRKSELRRGDSTPAEGIEAKLRSKISVNFRNKPLVEAIESVQAMTGLNFVLDNVALEEAGIPTDVRLSMKLDAVPLQAALRLLLSSRGLTYVVKDEVIFVTTPHKARGHQTRRVYDVSDLVPGDKPPEQPVRFYAGDRFSFRGFPDPSGKPQEQATALIKLITQSVAPQTWLEVGGSGTIDYFALGKCLVINQTPDVHEEIEGLLSTVRELNKGLKPK
jgi:RNA polymerase sigma factor (sigma-70 family)